jgi:hypothetical protein
VREYLQTLDSRFRVVGGSVFNHLLTPQSAPAYISGYHPLDSMPSCYEQRAGENGCTRRHYKHPLQRFDRDRTFIGNGVGAHYVLSPDTAVGSPAPARPGPSTSRRERSTTPGSGCEISRTSMTGDGARSRSTRGAIRPWLRWSPDRGRSSRGAGTPRKRWSERNGSTEHGPGRSLTRVGGTAAASAKESTRGR